MTGTVPPTLARFQSAFARLLLADGDGDGADVPGGRPAFAVYRNTVRKACVDALEANYPTVARLVGVDWFRAAASLHAVAAPPRDGRLLHYGAGFPDFLAHFPPAASLPYLPGVARLDRCWTEAHVAADAACLDPALLLRLPPGELGALRVRPHPAARWGWFEHQPVYTIWQRERAPATARPDVDAPFAWQGEGALLIRPADAVAWCAIGRADVAFLDACAAHRPLGAAAQAASDARPDVDLPALFARLLRVGALALDDVPGRPA